MVIFTDYLFFLSWSASMGAAGLFSHRKTLSQKQATLFLAILLFTAAARCHTANQFSWLLQSNKNRVCTIPGNPAAVWGSSSGEKTQPKPNQQQQQNQHPPSPPPKTNQKTNPKKTPTYFSLKNTAVGKEHHPQCALRFTGTFQMEWLLSTISALLAGNQISCCSMIQCFTQFYEFVVPGVLH